MPISRAVLVVYLLLENKKAKEEQQLMLGLWPLSKVQIIQITNITLFYSADPSVVASGLVSSTFNSLLHRGQLTCSGSSIGSSSLLSDGHLLSKCASSTSACTSVSSFLHTNSLY
jgi:hypothetical protein